MASRLPIEVVAHIMRFLNVSDRKEAALVCRTWYEASLDPILQTGVVLHFHSLTLSDHMQSFSRRKTPHLVLDDFDIKSSSLISESSRQLCGALQSLSLHSSNMTDRTFVDVLSHCKNLKYLDLSCCNSIFMSGNLLARDADIKKLNSVLVNVKDLNLSSIRYLSDVSFNRIMNICPNIQSLSLAGTPIHFYDQSYLFVPGTQTKCANSSVLTFTNVLDYVKNNSPKVKSLDISRSLIDDDALTVLMKLEGLQLERLILASCKDVTGTGVSSICKYQKLLKTLSFRGCTEITNGCIHMITSQLKLLENLDICKCKMISDVSVKQLKCLRNLQSVDLSDILQLTSEGLIEGLCCRSIDLPLMWLKLSCCPSITDSLVISVCNVRPHIVHLDLGSCFLLTDRIMKALKRLNSLRFLRLAWCKEITDLGLIEFEKVELPEKGAKTCEEQSKSTDTAHKSKLGGDQETSCNLHHGLCLLRTLDLSACMQLTDLGLSQILHFQELCSLSLDMVQITDITVATIATRNPSIENLSLAQCRRITDYSIDLVARSLARLSSLNVSSCDKLTNQSILSLKKNCKRLRSLDVSFCKQITSEAVDDLETSLGLQIVQKRLVGI